MQIITVNIDQIIFKSNRLVKTINDSLTINYYKIRKGGN